MYACAQGYGGRALAGLAEALLQRELFDVHAPVTVDGPWDLMCVCLCVRARGRVADCLSLFVHAVLLIHSSEHPRVGVLRAHGRARACVSIIRTERVSVFACRFATTVSNKSTATDGNTTTSSSNNDNNDNNNNDDDDDDDNSNNKDTNDSNATCTTVSLSNNAGEQWCGNVTFWRWPASWQSVGRSSEPVSFSGAPPSCVELRSSASVPAHVDADDGALVADNVCVPGYDVFVLRCCQGS
jgi:hypothetical protein